ncbi:MAG: hypothetical protein IPK59_12005 [Rhodospirillaceae bacterium]|nr:hypothetical protein [Rhodospirillaceae bacterium]
MPLRALNLADLVTIGQAMRDADRREIFATRFDEDAALLAEDLLASDPVGAVVASADGTAVAALGGIEMWPGNWSLWMYATDRWPEVARATTRFARHVLWPSLLRLGLRRGECRSALDHDVAHRWLSYLGGEVEAIYPAYGKGGETFIGFVIYGETGMCATPKKRNPGRVSTRKSPVVDPNAPPQANDLVADAAGEAELRRLRALYGRRATILTPERQALGQAPVAQKTLLGS